jgi:hypothetical protein
MTHEDLDKVNHAIKSNTFCVQELKRKVEHELYMAESAAIAGWGTVRVLENKIYQNLSGANAAEKELKTQKIRGHDYYAPRAMALGGQGGRKSSYGDGQEGGYGGGRGRGGYGNRGPGGFGGGPKGTRTCHRLVHLLR